MSLRTYLLNACYWLFPFPLKGDAIVDSADEDTDISCIINFYGRPHLLQGILYSLEEQNYPRDRFEIILIEDRDGSQEGKILAERFSRTLRLRYETIHDRFGLMGYARNYGLSLSRGKYILFLDDDTVILQKDFLSRLVEEFQLLNADAMIPHGRASFYYLKGRYGYHEPYYPTNRCMVYRRESLRDMGAFISNIIGQEDVEFAVRMALSRKYVVTASNLEYYHPPLFVADLNKARAVGFSFYGLKYRYSYVIWILLLINCMRHLPYLLIPIGRFKHRGRFALGFLTGVLDGILGKTQQEYR